MSNPEELFALHLRAMRIMPPVREYKFHPKRRWRLDFAWPDDLIAVGFLIKTYFQRVIILNDSFEVTFGVKVDQLGVLFVLKS